MRPPNCLSGTTREGVSLGKQRPARHMGRIERAKLIKEFLLGALLGASAQRKNRIASIHAGFKAFFDSHRSASTRKKPPSLEVFFRLLMDKIQKNRSAPSSEKRYNPAIAGKRILAQNLSKLSALAVAKVSKPAQGVSRSRNAQRRTSRPTAPAGRTSSTTTCGPIPGHLCRPPHRRHTGRGSGHGSRRQGAHADLGSENRDGNASARTN